MATILLTGDVMLGRGIDQILPCPSPPEIYEPYLRSALDYVALAERQCGAIPRAVAFDYVWGDALDIFRGTPPDVRIVNLETALTCCAVPAPKGINYRCHPGNVPCLAVAAIDGCVLANNHVLDWGEEGLIETLDALAQAGLHAAGAGRNLAEAQAPAILPLAGGGRVLVHALGTESSGVPSAWAARPDRPGVNFLGEPFEAAVESLAGRIGRDKRAGDVAIVSIHWGPNWGYEVPEEHRRLARALIDDAQVDIVHGHSSHHPQAIEFHRGRPILYGCGDLINDYEGISGEEVYRPDLVLVYLVSVAADGRCSALELRPFRIAGFRLNRATREEAEWLATTLDCISRPFGVGVMTDPHASGGADGVRLRAAPI